MARTVEDSDDELPELEDLVKSLKARAREPTRGGKSTKVDVDDVVTGNASTGRSNDRASGKEDGTKISGVLQGENGRELKKKRVLNQRDDNPLLRPLNVRSASSGLVGKREKTSGKCFKESDGVGNVSGEAKMVLKMKSRSIAPLDESVSDEEKPTAMRKVKNSRQNDGMRTTQPRSKSRSVTPLEEPKLPEQKPTAETKIKTKTKTRAAVQSLQQQKRPAFESESEEDYGSDGLSEFIVHDSTFLEEEDSVVEAPPPRSRKLVQGRRQKKEEEFDDDDLDLQLQNLNINDFVPGRISREISEEKELKEFADGYSDDDIPTKKSVPRKLFEDVRIEPPRRAQEASPQKKCDPPSSDIEDPLTLRYSPSESKPRKVSKETRFATPPGSPEAKPRGLQSPKKRFQRIPSTPHRQSMDTFWQQDVVNDWNDEYSPRKTPKPQPKSRLQDDDSEGNSQFSLKKSPVKQDRAAKEAKKAFSQRKHEIAEAFLAELDDKITNGQIAKLAASTGGIKIIWSKKLNTTAGRANWKRETVKSSLRLEDGKPAPAIHRHHAAIELAEKVIDDEDRLLNVIAHEFCHLANFMVSNIKTNPHGKEFKAWAAKCSRHFGDRGIEVTTKHSYTIDYKYIWECENCGIEYKRHSKSIDPARHQCGSCKSKLVQIKPAPRTGTGTGKVSEYQLFMKENMKKVKEENPASPQKEIMGLMGKKYQEYKASKLGDSKTVETVVIDEVEEKEGSPDEEIGFVARKLDFLDLTSP
ncbi:hypothetical protein EG329_007176 [Mollisiaceae sp. DMI_Dod_QoI]|nr:hypothetical protein EG329_007176 [Helotiales sp. DMI_Dod_QoI]